MELPVIELAGTSREMGRQFGEACRDAIVELYETRLEGAIQFARMWGHRTVRREEILDLAERCLASTRAYDPQGSDECVGIAEASGLTPAQLFAMQGLTDIRDVLAFSGVPDGEGCSAIILPRERSADGRLLFAQNWDLATTNMPYVRLVHRRPVDTPETWSLTLTGCLSLIGINSEGVGVGTTNVTTDDGSCGVHYLHVLHRALEARSFNDAVSCIVDAPRLSGHYFFLVSAEGPAAVFECSARQCVRHDVVSNEVVRCNHLLDAEVVTTQRVQYTTCSSYRQQRLEDLLEQHETVGIDDIKRMLSDHEGGDNAVCRHDLPPTGISTNAAVILSPETGEIHACRGQPHVGRWRTMGTAGHSA